MNQDYQNQCVWPRQSGRRHRADRGGHAPGYLRDALVEALECSFCADEPWWDALQIEFFDPAKQLCWDSAVPKNRALWLLGQLWNCTDIVSSEIWSELELTGGRTFGRLARLLKTQLIDDSES